MTMTMRRHHSSTFFRTSTSGPPPVLFLLLVSVWLLSEIVKGSPAPTKPTLRFRPDGTFKILQLTDLHFGEAEDTLWGPQQDVNSTRVMRTVLSIEEPDFVILTGDLITGNNIVNNATAYWKMIMDVITEFNIPWAITFGNHDDLASGTGGTRQDLMAFDISFNLSLSQFGPTDIPGVSNYVLFVNSSVDPTKAAAAMYIFDSGDSNCEGVEGWGCITTEQVAWYLERSQAIEAENNGLLPAVSFFHIPLQEYMYMWNTINCTGTNNDSVACQALNAGLFSAFKARGDVQFVTVGHNHGNDFCGLYDGVQLCFGRHSGYGGYGTWERGARVMLLTELPSQQLGIETWIRFETGELQPVGVPHSPEYPYQLQCY
eukprot:TRINITY_DN8201_c0_g1_i1.p1 TRINITY_DN8201_c0_g1~~TRINITY_DN8201_c0_g1_i1.p1  ORF type:complete len:384 (+),score=63.09 TRINITY_DN8201_c0_g1_i1:36-1154(+)